MCHYIHGPSPVWLVGNVRVENKVNCEEADFSNHPNPNPNPNPKTK